MLYFWSILNNITMNKVFTKLALTFSVMALVIAFSACNNDKENVQRFKDAAMSLDKTSHTLTDDYDYWPECGIRTTGSHLASLISLAELEKMLPCPLYVSGPHHDGKWDLDDETDFGHYNPKAIQYLTNLAKKVVSDKQFVEASKPLVDESIYDKMYIMMVLHDALYDDGLPEMMGTSSSVKETREEIFNEMIESNGSCFDIACYLPGSLFIDVDSWTGNGSNEHFVYFWARRWKDGTIDQFYDGLKTIFMAYHPEYDFHLENYIWEEDFGDGDWAEEYEETEYNCDLESDEPVTDAERIKENDAVEMIRKAVTNLDKTSYVFADGFDYWPECGIRTTGSHLFSLISLKTLNRMLPCDLYVSGPHYYNRWNLNHSYEFGHYNPEAVNYLDQLAKKVVADKKFVETTKPLVDKYLKRQMLIMKGLYDGMNDKDICPDKQAVLEDITDRKGNIYYAVDNCPSCNLLSSLDLEDGTFVYGNTGEMFLYFWGRRNVDGTMEQFHDILETIYNAYYSE